MTTTLELLANYVTTSVTSGGTTAPAPGTVEPWTVTSSTGFPAASSGGSPLTQFRIFDIVNTSEVMIVTNVAGTTWTVTRGAEGTTPIAHLANFDVAPIVTEGALTSSTGGVAVAALNSSGVLVAPISDQGGQMYNVKAFGAKGNGIIKLDGAMTAGSTTLTSATGTFVSTDVGKQMIVSTAGAVGSLTSALTQGNAYTSLSTTATTTSIPSGTHILLGFGAQSQLVVTSALASAGATTISVTSFTAAYAFPVGTPIDGEPLITTISTVVSATDVTLAAAATITVNGVQYAYGTDDSTTLGSVITTCIDANPVGGTIYFPPGIYLCNSVATPAQSTGWLSVVGGGEGNTVLLGNAATNSILNMRMPGIATEMTFDQNQLTLNGLLYSTGMTNMVTLSNAGSSTSGSTTLTLTGNHASALTAGMVISMVGAGTPIPATVAQSTPLTSTVVSATYNSSPNTTSVVVQTAAGTTTSGRNVAFGNALIPISRWDVGNVTFRNSGATGEYCFQVNDGSGSFPFIIDTLVIGRISVGPSYSTVQETVNMAFVNNCDAAGFVIEGVTGRIGPNFYAVNNLNVGRIDINVSTADNTDTVVFGQNYGSAGNYNVDSLIITDPNGVAQPILTYCSVLNASNWILPSNGLCYVDLNMIGNNQVTNFVNCALGSGLKVSYSPAPTTFLGGSVGVYGTGGCISNPNTGATGLVTADGTQFNLSGSAGSCIIYSTSTTIAPQVQFGNCNVINAAGTPVISNHGTVTGWVSSTPGLNPFGKQTAPTVGASPWTYTNTNPFAVTAYVTDSSTGTTVSIGGTVVATVPSGATVPISLSPQQAMVLTYTTAPTVQIVGA